jgi:hypothetical protein
MIGQYHDLPGGDQGQKQDKVKKGIAIVSLRVLAADLVATVATR